MCWLTVLFLMVTPYILWNWKIVTDFPPSGWPHGENMMFLLWLGLLVYPLLDIFEWRQARFVSAFAEKEGLYDLKEDVQNLSDIVVEVKEGLGDPNDSADLALKLKSEGFLKEK